jgi:hypothetical protein
MKKLAVLAGLALTMGLGDSAGRRTPRPFSYQQAAFDVVRKSGEPILVFGEAS